MKHTIVGISTVAGWGLVVREHVKKNEYLGEYIGEVNTKSTCHDYIIIEFT